ncbi:MAG: NAD kinase [Bacteroidota bacterium]
MNFALFGKSVVAEDISYIQLLVDKLELIDSRLFVHSVWYQTLNGAVRFSSEPILFSFQSEIRNKVDYLFSIGGDGTLLDTITLVGDSGIPIIGINMGRLGFLSSISKEEILPAIDEIVAGQYFFEQRSLLRLETPKNPFGEFNYALNDVTIYKTRPVSILTIKTFINDEFLNTYWADGLIVATPTGSTAYSLSCTGPILTPDSSNFVITPIASHNLTVRPIVIPDDCKITLVVESRGLNCLVGLDSRIENMDTSVKLEIVKEHFKINLFRRPNKNFFQTIREKLNWGLDIRN